MINPKTSWQLISSQARKAMNTQMIYHSLIEERKYKVLSVEANKIKMARLSGGNNATLTKAAVEKAIEKFNNNGCNSVPRRTLIEKPVINETTLVLFHPQLAWDETGDYIIAVNLV